MADMETGEQVAADPGTTSVPLKIAPIPDGYRSADTDDGRYNVVSNFESDQKALDEAVGAGKPKDEVKEAASKLGKKGGEASAKKREAEAKEAKPAEAPEATDDASGSDDKAADDGAEKPLGKPDRDPRARVAEATREAREAREEARQLREEASRVRYELEQERKSREQPKEPAAPQRDASQRPKLEDFADIEEWGEALTDWKLEHKFKAIEQEQGQRQQVETWARGAQQSMAAFEKVANEADEVDPGWRDRVDDRLWDKFRPTWMLDASEPVRPTNVIFDEIYGSPAMPALLLYFSDEQGQVEFSRIARLRSAREISREMAKLEERLKPATAGTRPESSVSKAPLPFQPVKGAPHTGERPPSDESDYDAYRAYMKKQKSASR